MKNKEKYASEIIEIACKYGAVNERTGELKGCSEIICEHCLFRKRGISRCKEKMKEWLESEYIEKPVISKKDRAFLEYLGKELKYIVRSKSNNLMAFQNSAEKREDGWVIGSGALKSLQRFNIDFPMVKWSDDSPWLIENLKKLEVVDSYE